MKYGAKHIILKESVKILQETSEDSKKKDWKRKNSQKNPIILK